LIIEPGLFTPFHHQHTGMKLRSYRQTRFLSLLPVKTPACTPLLHLFAKPVIPLCSAVGKAATFVQPSSNSKPVVRNKTYRFCEGSS
jgi:hypothetical protein